MSKKSSTGSKKTAVTAATAEGKQTESVRLSEGTVNLARGIKAALVAYWLSRPEGERPSNWHSLTLDDAILQGLKLLANELGGARLEEKGWTPA